jgi:heat shock protein HtpX
MAIHGYVTHAAANRRKLGWLIASYIVAFELIAAVALTVLLLFWDSGNTILTNPLGYAIRYTIPVALAAALVFRLFYHGHIKHVTERLAIIALQPGFETDANVKRFLRIAEEQCLALGIRLPQFGIINAPEPNALAVGATRDRGMIAVTRGLLDTLDDEELAAVLAHEAAHIRNGDTKILAANHALMRTSVNMQVNNPLRLESHMQVVLILAMPFFLPILLAGGAVTMFAMQMSFQARRGISLTRDLIADAEAVRLTHFPEALASALQKISGRGAFAGSERFETLLFCGGASAKEKNHPSLTKRIETIRSLGQSMMDANRIRRDTRPRHLAPVFQPVRHEPQAPLRGKTSAPPPMPSLLQILVRPKCWVEWHNACVDYGEWKENDKRDALGLQAKMYIPLAAAITFLLIFHWPSNGDYVGVLQLFNPAALISMASPSAESIVMFPGASAEAVQKQAFITIPIMAFFIIASSIPGLRELVYPHVDWTKKKKKSVAELLTDAAQTWSTPSFQESANDAWAQPSFQEKVIERELAKFKAKAELHDHDNMPPPTNTARPIMQPEHATPAPMQRATFGRKIT